MIRLVFAFVLATTVMTAAQEISQLPAAASVNSTDIIPCDQIGFTAIVLRRCTVNQLLSSPNISGPTIIGFESHLGDSTFAGGVNLDAGLLNIRPAALAAQDWYHSPHAIWLGGSTDYNPAALQMRGAPYGECGTGVLLSAWASNRSMAHSPEGASCTEDTPALIATNGLFDAIAVYSGGENYGPALTVGNSNTVTFDATHAYFSPPLTAAQVASVLPLQWVYLNATKPGYPTAPAGTTYQGGGYQPYDNHYAGVLTGVDPAGASITVTGWTVPGGCINDPVNCTTYQSPMVPATSALDTSNGHSNPTVFFGAPNQLFGANVVIQNSPTTPDNLDSHIHSLQWVEADIQDYATVNYQSHIAGISIAYSPIGGARPDRKSYGEIVSGPFPAGMVTSLLLQPDGVGTTNISRRDITYDDTNKLNFVQWTQRDSTASGWPGSSVHLGLFIDSTDLLDTTSNPRGSIGFDEQGYAGGICLDGVNVHSFCITSAGQAVANYALTAQGGIISASNIIMMSGAAAIFGAPSQGSNLGPTLASDSSGDLVIGTSLAGGGKLVSPFGMDLSGAATLRSTVAIVGELSLSTAIYNEPLNASLPAQCAVGDRAATTTQLSVCVATNTWKSAAIN